MIAIIAKALGLDSLAVYAIIALLAGGGIWAWSAHKYNTGYNAGTTQERMAWEELRKRELAKQAAQKAADQAKLDQIEAETLAEKQALEQRADKAEADLTEALKDADPKPILSKKIGAAINGTGR